MRRPQLWEYIFDWSWANASHRSGIPYYPTRVCCAFYTCNEYSNTAALERTRTGAPSARSGGKQSPAILGPCLFMSCSLHKPNSNNLKNRGIMPRTTFQFHWMNQDWTDFEDYLTAFRAPSRKRIRKSGNGRPNAAEIVVKTGDELSNEEWASLYPLYRATAHQGLSLFIETFFSEIRQYFASHLVVCMALDQTTPMAGSISFQVTIFGRYWGCLDHAEFAFRMCYRLIGGL